MTAYVKLSTMEFPRYEGDIRLEHPEIPANAFVCPSTYAPVVIEETPAYDWSRYRVAGNILNNRDGVWYAGWNVEPIPDDIGAARVREQRNKLLAECDWTQLADSPVDKAAWATYRQALRDVPAQAGFPWEVTWPTKPE